MKTACITGSNSGVGLALSVLLAKNNYKVYATMRNLSSGKELSEELEKEGVSKNVTMVALDVTSDKSCSECFEKILKEGTVDVLVG